MVHDSVDMPAYGISVVVTGSCCVLSCAVLDCLLGVDPAAVADSCSPLRSYCTILYYQGIL